MPQPTLFAPDAAESSEASTDLRFELGQDLTADILQTEMQSSAASLIEALFTDVDRMLERGVAPEVETPSVSQTVASEAAQAEPDEPVVPLAAILPPKLAPRDLMPQPDLPDLEPEPGSEPAPSKTSKTGKTGLWLALLCSSLLLSAGLLSFLYRTQVSQFWLYLLEQYWPAAPDLTAAAPSPAPENADFLQYLSRSMERLSRQTKQESSASPPPSPTVAASPSPSVIERVYVPVYPTTTAPAMQPAPVAPAAPSGAPAAQRPTTPASPRPAPASPVPNIANANNHTLLGVLELGDRSSALFEVNGTPQRIEMGEAIGSSGWALVSVSNQEAIVRRNGEVRSIYVGQKF